MAQATASSVEMFFLRCEKKVFGPDILFEIDTFNSSKRKKAAVSDNLFELLSLLFTKQQRQPEPIQKPLQHKR